MATAVHCQCAGFWIHVNQHDVNYTTHMNFALLIEGLFGAGAVMISYGAIIGRTTPAQNVVMTFFEVRVSLLCQLSESSYHAWIGTP